MEQGTIYCSDLGLTTQEGCPEIVNGSFTAHGNKLTNLIGGPKYTKGFYTANNNLLTSLEEAPITVGGSFECYNNPTNFTFSEVKKAI